MPWKGIYRVLDPGVEAEWTSAGDIVGVVYQTYDNDSGEVKIEVTVPKDFIEDDGRPFENGEEVEFVVRRVNNAPIN